MQVKPVSPPNGSELLVLNKDGRTLYVTRPQVAAILASTGVRSKPMRSVLTEKTGQERYRAIQGGVLVEFSLADFTAYLAGTATPDPVPFGRGLDVYSGTERFVGRQGTGLIASDILQTMYVRGLGGSLSGLGGDIPDNPLPPPVQTTTLNALLLSSTSFLTGGVTSVGITGKTAGSSIAATSSDGTTLSVSGSTLSGTFTAAGSCNITLVETLAGAVNSGRQSVVGVTITAVTGVPTPDGALEAVMSPANTTLRSTYVMTASDGIAIPIPAQMIKTDGTVDGGGVYYAGGGSVKMPSAAYPDRRFHYYGKDHGPGTSVTNGIYMSVTVGDPSVAANYKVYEDAVAAGWLADIPNLPASNPIWPGATGSTQPETPYAMWVADDDGKNGMVVMAYQTGGNAKSHYDGSDYRDQATVRATSVDGIHFTGDLVAWAENRTIDAGYAHTGYMHFAKSIFLNFPYKYIGYSLGGIYGCNDPRTEFWQNVTGLEAYGGRMLAGLTSGWIAQPNRWLPQTAKRTAKGVSMLVTIAGPQSGAGLSNGAIFEVLMSEDGQEVIAKPQNIFALGAAGSGYEVDITAQSYGVHGDKEFIVIDGGGRRDAETANKKRGFVASSPRRNPLNTVFDPLSPPTPANMRKRPLSLRGTSLPSDLMIYTTGTPTITYDADGGMVVSGVAGDKVVIVEKEGFDPNTTEMVDVLARDWSAISTVTDTADAFRVPWVGITAEPGPLADMLNVRAFTLNPSASYGEAIHVRNDGAATNTAYAFVQTMGYGAASPEGKQRKDHGFRWFPQDIGNACIELSNGGVETKTITTQMAMASVTRGKRLHRFVAFEFTGVTRAAVRGLRSHEYDSNPRPQTGKTLTLSNPKPDVGAAWTSFILNHTVGSAITATSSDGTALTVGTTDNTGKRSLSGTFANAGTPTITINETPVGSTLKTSTIGLTVAAPPVGVTVVGTPTVFTNGANNVTYTTAATDIGTATEDRYVVALFELIANDTTEFGALAATITPAGGAAIPMTLVKQVQTNIDTPYTAAGPNVIAAFVAKVPASVTTATTATATVTRSGAGVASRMGGCMIAARNLNPALVDFAANGAARGTNSNSPMPVVIDKPAKGLVVATAYFSTSGATFTGAAYEVPTATGIDAAVASNNNQATQTWTGLANVMLPANAQIENSGSGGGTLLAVSFAPAS